MKARIQATNNRTSTHVLSVTLNPIEAQRILESIDVVDGSSSAARTFFMYLLAISDENAELKYLINNDAPSEDLWIARKRLISSGDD